MKKDVTEYTVKQLAELAKVSVKTLHHYDKIGLLQPAYRAANGYRVYTREQLLILQQILFYKELEFSLADISKIILAADFSLLESLQFHRQQIEQRIHKSQQLIETIDKTIHVLTNCEVESMTDEEIYVGFKAEEVDSIRAEAMHKWGEPQVVACEARIKQLSKQDWQLHLQQGEEIYQAIADSMVLAIESDEVQALIGRMHQHLRFYWNVDLVALRGLAEMYISDERFTAYFDQFAPGLADYIHKAIGEYTKNDFLL